MACTSGASAETKCLLMLEVKSETREITGLFFNSIRLQKWASLEYVRYLVKWEKGFILFRQNIRLPTKGGNME